MRGVRLAAGALGLVIVVGVFGRLLPSLTSYSSVADAVADISRSSHVALAALAVANVLAPAIVQAVVLPGLGLVRAAVSDWSSTLLSNLVPGGTVPAMGLTWTMYRSWGHEPSAIARSMVATGIVDNLVKLALPAVSVALLARDRELDPTLGASALVGLALLVVALVLCAVVGGSPSVGARIGGGLNAAPLLGTGWDERIEQWRSASLELAHERGGAVVALTVIGNLNLFAILLIACRSTGVTSAELSWPAILAALAFGRLVTAVPLTPGGAGVAELGLLGMLSALGSAPHAALVPPVMIFRAITFALPIPLGLVAWLGWSVTQARSS